MRDQLPYDYSVIRVAPRVDREEFINVGIILSCPDRQYLAARIALDQGRLTGLNPDVDMETIQAHLAAIPVICAGGEEAGPIGRLSQRERFHWLVAPRSTMIQTSPVHSGRCSDPVIALDRLMQKMVL